MSVKIRFFVTKKGNAKVVQIFITFLTPLNVCRVKIRLMRFVINVKMDLSLIQNQNNVKNVQINVKYVH